MTNSRRLTLLASFFLLCALAGTTLAADGPLAEDTAAATTQGNPFIAPEGWTLTVRGPATIMEAPEGGSFIVLVDVEAEDADAAVAAGWAAYQSNERELHIANDMPDNDGWSGRKHFQYKTSPNEKRSVSAGAWHANEGWTVWIYDMAHEVGGKRGAQVNLLFSSLLPQGYSRETFTNREPKDLDDASVTDLSNFVIDAQKASGVPGVSIGIIQDGEVVFSGGFGVRELGKPEPVDGDTLYMVASNTKALATLMLAKLVEAEKIGWKDPVTQLLPSFRLGDQATTDQVLVEHLICACTGMPRQDLEWIFEYGDLTPASAMELLARMQPTSDFGEMFQYSNMMAAAAGFAGGHVMYPDMELGAAFDRAMQETVFDPLGMADTTFDYARALGTPNHASPHSQNYRHEQTVASMDFNHAAIPVRPAGAAWSSVNDMLKYVAMELAEGVLPNGETYIAKGPLLERRKPMVPLNEDASYGMGLMTDETWGVKVVHHGGDLLGFHSDMMWLPDHGVGAVVLTNGDPGWQIRDHFQRRLLEVVFEGNPEAATNMAAASDRYYDSLRAGVAELVIPPDPDAAAALADSYSNEALGYITVRREEGGLAFDLGEWTSPMASRENPDGTISFVTTEPGLIGFEFTVANGDDKALLVRDAQHEYVFSAN